VDHKTPTQEKVAIRNMIKTKERERRIQETFKWIPTRNKAKKLADELHQVKKTLRALKKDKNVK